MIINGKRIQSEKMFPKKKNVIFIGNGRNGRQVMSEESNTSGDIGVSIGMRKSNGIDTVDSFVRESEKNGNRREKGK